MRTRVKDGAAEWDAVNTSLDFKFDGTDLSESFNDCPNALDKSTVFYLSIIDPPGEDILGYTLSCPYNSDSTRLKAFHLAFDSGNSWYSGTGDPSASDVDTWSVATHELGHAGGFSGHFAGAVCSSSPSTTDQTMCPNYEFGRKCWRTLETHDIHTFASRY